MDEVDRIKAASMLRERTRVLKIIDGIRDEHARKLDIDMLDTLDYDEMEQAELVVDLLGFIREKVAQGD